jgi:NADH-ubiquinone oxidoreductase chain 4
MLSLIPRISFWWFILRACNMAAPPSLNLLGEIRLLNRLISWSWVSIFFLMFLSFFRAAYTLYLFSYSQHGSYYSGIYSCSLGYSREFLLLFLHWFPLNLFIMRSEFVMFWL